MKDTRSEVISKTKRSLKKSVRRDGRTNGRKTGRTRKQVKENFSLKMSVFISKQYLNKVDF